MESVKLCTKSLTLPDIAMAGLVLILKEKIHAKWNVEHCIKTRGAEKYDINLGILYSICNAKGQLCNKIKQFMPARKRLHDRMHLKLGGTRIVASTSPKLQRSSKRTVLYEEG